MHAAKVLVVDDSPTMRQYIVFALQRFPALQIDQAGDGVAALKQLATKKYDLMFTDINMPMMDGMKLVGLVRNDSAYEKLPIVMITTEGSKFTREKAIAKGATEYITKPLQTSKLIEVTRRLLDPEQQQG